MKLVASRHWQDERNDRSDITDDLLEYAVLNGDPVPDRRWAGALNVLVRVPPSGRLLKVVYRRTRDETLIITAYWLN